MALNDDELDFSSYLVDLDDEDAAANANAASFPKAGQSSSNNAGFNMNFTQPMPAYGHPQMHSAKNWPNALLHFNLPTGSISPSPPETSSDSSYRASTTTNSTPSTAASSIASTSYTGSHGSWRTERASSLKEQVMFNQSRPQANGHAASGYGLAANLSGSLPASQPFNLSFDYDFTHDPSASGSHTPVGVTNSGTGSSSSSRRGSLLAASMPTSADWSVLSSQQSTLASQSFNSAFSENLIPPSSGPTSAAHRPSRSRQSSNVAFPAGTSPGGAASGWAALGCISEKTPIISSIASSYPSKPYARPESSTSSSLASGSGNHGSLSRKASKRKSTSSSNALSFASLSEQKNANQAGSLPPKSTFNQTQSSASSPSDLYRDPASAFASPISPAVDTFPPFAVPTSSTTSPSHRGSSSANTPSDGANASDLTLLASPINSSLTSGSNSDAVDVDKAAAMAGLGPKWFNWASQQQQSSQPVISSVLSQQTPLLSPTSPSRTVPGQIGTALHSLPPAQAQNSGRSTQGRPFTRETSLAPEALTSWPDLEDQSPEALAANDPLATQLWRMVNKAKAGLPSGARMENLTWRMMSLRVNKQKEKQAAAEKAAAEEQAQAEAKRAAAAQSSQVARFAVEEDGRGRKGRGASQSASPNEPPAVDDFMDWRQASRSRSRPSSVMAMDWRGASRSRSRAPNMRISIPASPSTFVSPLHTELSSQDHAYQGDLGQPAPPEATNTAVTGTVSSGKNNSNGQSESLEETLKSFMAQHAAMTMSSPASQVGNAFAGPASAPLTFDTDLFAQATALTANSSASLAPPQDPVSSGSMPVSYNAWQPSLNGVDSALAQSYTSAATSLSLPFEENPTLPPMPQSTFVNESRDSISASVEAYLKSLDYSTSVLDLPAQRHAGSVPGIFREQDLKVNQHADYGFLPKLVRKTSFDASYPAALQKKNQSSQSKATEAKNNAKAAAPAQQQTLQSRNTVAQSTPGTPAASFASTPFDFTSVYNTASPQMPVPSSAEVLHAMKNPYAASSQAAALEAFRRLQHVQAQASMQSAASQPILPYSPYMDPNMMAVAAAAASSTVPNFMPTSSNPYDVFAQGMLGNPSQALADVSMAQAAFNHEQQMAWLQSMQMPSSLPSVPMPEAELAKSPASTVQDTSTAAAASESARNGTSTSDAKPKNRPTPATNPQPTNKKTHSRSHSTASDAGNTATLAPSMNPDGTSITCVNCKTTTTPLWRRDEHGQPLCNACQLFRKLHGSDRPANLHNGVIKKRNRARNNQKDIPKKTGSRSRRTSINIPREDEDSTDVN